MPVPRFLDGFDFRMGRARDRVILNAPMRYQSEGGRVFTVPAGIATDLASVPRILRSLAPTWHQTARAGILHDWLYRTGKVPRREADRLFREALRADRVPAFRAFGMWLAVRVFGAPHYKRG